MVFTGIFYREKGHRMLKTFLPHLQRLLRFLGNWFKISAERRRSIYVEVKTGSDPRLNYYLLLLLSALITTFGMIADSPAVVIGAMLVCPLMTPIFGIALSLVEGDTSLLKSALLAELGGIVLVILAAFLIGISPFSFEMTHEILNNTSPTLLDLFVAALAGFAVCMATIDERLSPSLPGIAVSISLTPPLTACGLCFAFGAYEGGMGALILFMANFLTMLFVAGLTFMAAGFIPGSFSMHKMDFARRFGPALISMIVLVCFLTHAMVRLIEEKNLVAEVRRTFQQELTDVQNLEIRDITLDRSQNGKEWNVLVVIDAPREPSPFHLREVENRLQTRLHCPINVFVQTRITRNVSASQDKLIRFYRSADGIEKVNRPGKDVQILNVAGQIVRERIEQLPGMQVTDIELRRLPNGRKVIYTTLQGAIRPFPGGIKRIEEKIQSALKDRSLRLVARYIESYDVASDGINVEGLMPDTTTRNTPAEHLQQRAMTEIRRLASLSPQAVKAGLVEGRWIIVAEISGSAVMTSSQARAIQDALQSGVTQKVVFMAFSKAEAMVSGEPLE